MLVSKKPRLYEFEAGRSFVRVDLITRMFVNDGDELIFFCQGTRGRKDSNHAQPENGKLHYRKIVEMLRDGTE